MPKKKSLVSDDRLKATSTGSKAQLKDAIGLKSKQGLRTLFNYSQANPNNAISTNQDSLLSGLDFHDLMGLSSHEGLKTLIRYAGSVQQDNVINDLVKLDAQAITGLKGKDGLTILMHYIKQDEHLTIVAGDIIAKISGKDNYESRLDIIAPSQDQISTASADHELDYNGYFGDDSEPVVATIVEEEADQDVVPEKVALEPKKDEVSQEDQYIGELLQKIMPPIRIARFDANLAGKIESQIDMAIDILKFRLFSELQPGQIKDETAEALRLAIDKLTTSLMPNLDDSQRLALSYLIVDIVAVTDNAELDNTIDGSVIDPLLSGIMSQGRVGGIDAINVQTKVVVDILEANSNNNDGKQADRQAYLGLLQDVNARVNKTHDAKQRYNWMAKGFYLFTIASVALFFVAPLYPVLLLVADRSAPTLAVGIAIGVAGYLAASVASNSQSGAELQQLNVFLVGGDVGENAEKMQTLKESMLADNNNDIEKGHAVAIGESPLHSQSFGGINDDQGNSSELTTSDLDNTTVKLDSGKLNGAAGDIKQPVSTAETTIGKPS